MHIKKSDEQQGYSRERRLILPIRGGGSVERGGNQPLMQVNVCPGEWA